MASTSLSPSRTRLGARLARGSELAAHHDVRRRVFVDGQRIFAHDDRDDRDPRPETLHVVGLVDGRIGGAVRLYPLGGGHWRGDRLAVLEEHRLCRLGMVLVEFAVGTAAARGGHTMEAHIQLANVAFFRQLGWEPAAPAVDFHGRAHQPMTIDLTAPSP